MKPLVSVVIPVYNSESYIGKTIQSCLDQTHEAIEIIVINDGSTDRSSEIIQSYKDSRIKFHEISNRGACEARNYGISMANGELFQFLDHDDLLKSDKIEHQVNAYLNHGNQLVYSARMGTVSGCKVKLEEGFGLFERDFTAVQYFETVLNQFSRFLSTGVWLVPRRLVESTHGWDSRAGINDDGEYFMRVILNSHGIRYCDGAEFYFRRDVPGSLSKRKDGREVFEKWLWSYESYVSHFHEVFSPEIARQLSWKALSVYYCDSYPHFPDLRASCRKQIQDLGYRCAFPHGGEKLVKIARWVGTDLALRLWAWKNGLKG